MSRSSSRANSFTVVSIDGVDGSPAGTGSSHRVSGLTHAYVANPFEALAFGAEMESQYLSDAACRLRNCEYWNINTTKETRGLLGATRDAPEIQANLGDIGNKMQGEVSSSILPLREDIFSMAHTLMEMLKLSEEPNLDVEVFTICNQFLDNVTEQIMQQFIEQKKVLTALSHQYHLTMLKNIEARDSLTSRSSMCFYFGISAITLSIFGFTVLGVGFKNPRLLGNTSFTTRETVSTGWWGRETHVRFEAKLTAFLGGGAAALGMMGLGVVALLQSKQYQADKKDLYAKANAFQKIAVQQHQSMWHGVFMSMENLKSSLAQIRNLDPRRVDRKQIIMRDIGWRLFAVSMAVDEMIVWLSERDYFPSNFSVRSALQPSRYDRIKQVFASVKEQLGQSDMQASAQQAKFGPL